MMVALIDNGSLEPAAHRNLRAVAAALTTRTGVLVRAVSWKHSDRVTEDELDGSPAWILESFVRSMFALGQREFVFVPFFVSPQGAIGSALLRDLESLRLQLGDFAFSFTGGLTEQGIIPTIVAERIRSCIAQHALVRPTVIVVDHGGPSRASAALRDKLTGEIRIALAAETDTVVAASMEGSFPPLLSDELRNPSHIERDVVVASLFLTPGRHAGADGDLARICRTAHSRTHLTDVIGSHPLVVDALVDALRTAVSNVHVHSFA